MNKYDFVDNFNDVQIRKCIKNCRCKVCDREVKDKDIIYLKSCRLQAQPFHICLNCWNKINELVEDYRKENKVGQN